MASTTHSETETDRTHTTTEHDTESKKEMTTVDCLTSTIGEPEGNEKPPIEDVIEADLCEIQEMIAFLDYSFERAFTLNEKNYILAYKKHALEIQG